MARWMGNGMGGPFRNRRCHRVGARKPACLARFSAGGARRWRAGAPADRKQALTAGGRMKASPLNLLCPACHTPLPADADAVVTCSTCSAEVDVTRAGTISGRPRFVPEIDRTGTDVGGYRIESRLGGGGMGTVYRAIAAGRRRRRAQVPGARRWPTIPTSSRASPARSSCCRASITRRSCACSRTGRMTPRRGSRWRWSREATCARASRAGALPPAETAAVFGRLFAALAHAHERGVVHRDLKPANVLLGRRRRAAGRLRHRPLRGRDAGGTDVTRLTETAAVLGTLPYMSPEQRRGGAIDRRSDLFSAGVMLYEAATGAVPQGAFAPPSHLNGAYGRAFDRIVMQLLQADPARRPAGAAEVAIGAGGGAGAASASAARDRGLGRRARADARRRNPGDARDVSRRRQKAPRRHRRRRWCRTRTRRRRPPAPEKQATPRDGEPTDPSCSRRRPTRPQKAAHQDEDTGWC